MKNIRAWIFGSVVILGLAWFVVTRTQIQDALTQRVMAVQPANTTEPIDLPAAINPTDPAPTPSLLTPTSAATPMETPPLLPTVLPTETAEPIRECREFSNDLVTCRVQQAFCTYRPSTKGKPTFCNDGKYPNHQFTYLVWGRDVSSYNGHCLILEGRVEMYKGKAEITSEDDSAFVKFCDGE